MLNTDRFPLKLITINVEELHEVLTAVEHRSPGTFLHLMREYPHNYLSETLIQMAHKVRPQRNNGPVIQMEGYLPDAIPSPEDRVNSKIALDKELGRYWL